MCNDEICSRVLGANTRSLHHIRWLGQVLCMPAKVLPFRAIYARAGQCWRGYVAVRLTWRRCLKKLVLVLVLLDASRLRGCSTGVRIVAGFG